MGRGENMKPDKKTEDNHIEIWGDNVNLKDLLISMFLCISLALIGYLLAFGDTPPLIFGLAGAVLGFIISSIIVKPKRHVKLMRGDDD